LNLSNNNYTLNSSKSKYNLKDVINSAEIISESFNSYCEFPISYLYTLTRYEKAYLLTRLIFNKYSKADFRSNEEIAQTLGCSVRTIQRCTKKFKDYGIITIYQPHFLHENICKINPLINHDEWIDYLVDQKVIHNKNVTRNIYNSFSYNKPIISKYTGLSNTMLERVKKNHKNGFMGFSKEKVSMNNTKPKNSSFSVNDIFTKTQKEWLLKLTPDKFESTKNILNRYINFYLFDKKTLSLMSDIDKYTTLKNNKNIRTQIALALNLNLLEYLKLFIFNTNALSNVISETNFKNKNIRDQKGLFFFLCSKINKPNKSDWKLYYEVLCPIYNVDPKIVDTAYVPRPSQVADVLTTKKEGMAAAEFVDLMSKAETDIYINNMRDHIIKVKNQTGYSTLTFEKWKETYLTALSFAPQSSLDRLIKTAKETGWDVDEWIKEQTH